MAGGALPDVVRRAVDAGDAVALLSDFDGVIAPLVEDPAQSRPLDGMVEALTTLLPSFTVGLVSGRPISFLSKFFDRRFLKIGLYGIEVEIDGVRQDLELEQWRQVIDEVTKAAAVDLDDVLVESKGLSMTLHYRSSPDLGPTVLAFAAAHADRTGLLARPAKMSCELHPPIEVDKGTAIESLFSDVDGVVYLGDDLGDLAAIDGLDRLRESGMATASVAVGGVETPQALLDRADHVVDGPEGALALLHDLGSFGG